VNSEQFLVGPAIQSPDFPISSADFMLFRTVIPQ